MVQRGHNFAIVDEVDSILIDEARTPLIISGPADQSSRWYTEFARMSPMMKKDVHYEVDERKRTVGVTEKGVAFIEDQLGIENLYEAANTPLVGYLNNALKAKELYKNDKDYIVRNGEVLIVDEFTGRILAGRRYNEGMHQAIEAKEKVEIKAENQTLATITLQNYFRLYNKLSGMTGTAETEAAEFQNTYKLGVVPIPTNRPMVRIDRSDLIYKTEEAKFEAVAEDIAERHENGPAGAGRHHQRRAVGVPVEAAGQEAHPAQRAEREAPREGVGDRRRGRAQGRGHGRDEHGRSWYRHRARRQPGPPGGGACCASAASTRSRRRRSGSAALPDGAGEGAEDEVRAEAEEVREAGGLYVLGTERHESRRIDNQLRGRSGRQGDPGESRFYLSLGDELMRRFNAQFVERVMVTMRVPDDQPIEAKMVTRAIRSAQTQVEQQNFEIRKDVLKYDEVMNRQRKVIYARAQRVLKGEDLRDQVENMVTDVVADYVRAETTGGYAEDWDHEKLWTALKTLYPISLKWDDLVEEMETDGDGPHRGVPARRPSSPTPAARTTRARGRDRRQRPARARMRQLERQVMLSVLDRKWREHLYEMDYLKQGIGLRAMAQRDPLIEYQREGFDMFATMLDGAEGGVRQLPVQPAGRAAGAGALRRGGTAVGRGPGRACPACGAGGPGRGGGAACPGAARPRRRRSRRHCVARASAAAEGQQQLTYSGPLRTAASSRGAAEQQRRRAAAVAAAAPAASAGPPRATRRRRARRARAARRYDVTALV